jgi:hypothetical protein
VIRYWAGGGPFLGVCTETSVTRRLGSPGTMQMFRKSVLALDAHFYTSRSEASYLAGVKLGNPEVARWTSSNSGLINRMAVT